jgi:hypothetical protein
MTNWRENCASRFEGYKAVNDVGESRLSPWPPKKNTEKFLAKAETFLANTSDLETQQKVDASCQQILGLE